MSISRHFVATVLCSVASMSLTDLGFVLGEQATLRFWSLCRTSGATSPTGLCPNYTNFIIIHGLILTETTHFTTIIASWTIGLSSM